MMRARFVSRSLGLIIVAASALVAACSDSNSQPVSTETPEQAAARVLALAQDLESKGQTQKAYAAYHLLIRKFPTSREAAMANARLTKVQAEAGRKPKAVVKKPRR
jgi:hypothetical protein